MEALAPRVQDIICKVEVKLSEAFNGISKIVNSQMNLFKTRIN